ncbi:MAG: dTMP kinase [Nanoarchaeota archaeon]
MKGRLIVIDGGDGSGKKTQAELLRKRLEQEGKEVVFFDFPVYESFYGKLVGRYLRGEFGSLDEVSPEFAALLYALDRRAEREKIVSALEAGKIVLCNRYVPSNLAYQGAKIPVESQGEFISWVEEMEYQVHGMPKPDQVIFLDVPAVVGQRLVDKKGRRDYVDGRDLHEENTDYLQSVVLLYKKLAKKEGWVVIPCVEHDQLLSREAIHSLVRKAVKD